MDSEPGILEEIWSLGFAGKLKDAVAVSVNRRHLYLARGNRILIHPLPTFPIELSEPSKCMPTSASPQRRAMAPKRDECITDNFIEIQPEPEVKRNETRAGARRKGSDADSERSASISALGESLQTPYWKCHRFDINAFAVSSDERFLASGECHPKNGRDPTSKAVGVYAGSESGDILKFRLYEGWKPSQVLLPDDSSSISNNRESAKTPGVSDALFLGALAPKCGPKSHPVRNPFRKGITSLAAIPSFSGIIVGCGDGTFAIVEDRTSYEDDQNAEIRAMKARRTKTKVPQGPNRLEGLLLKIMNTTSVNGSISGIAMFCDPDASLKKNYAILTTLKHNLIRIDLDTLHWELMMSNHVGTVYAVATPRKYLDAEFFATCGGNEIRLWHFGSKEALKVLNSDKEKCSCLSLAFFPRWSDGAIRAWAVDHLAASKQDPLLESLDCHPGQSVVCLGIVSGGNYLLSAGSDGSIKLWETFMSGGRRRLRMDRSSRQHKNRITSLMIEENRELPTWDLRFASASLDRTCVVWSLRDLRPLHIFRANCVFHDLCFHPGEPELVTAGSDARIHYWDAFSGTHMRTVITPQIEPHSKSDWSLESVQIDGKPSVGLSSVDIETVTGDGEFFVTGGQSRVIQVWSYVSGKRLAVSSELSGAVQHVKLHPSGKIIVAVTEDGSISLWRYRRHKRSPSDF
ncbi:unnamed protein product [Notodromas monacha]|uniref:Uncharacterized protein n=1 Tax=Notodromas monacha TaxID=399045 RepID=A0A7R9GD92_9CRUS|nr:unnamed protein product [Notodromas monacha]CAG0916725.1 unnamed protein product [Notodromas monacha]